jgi:predicted GNAT family N-acyltransferase
MCQAEIITTDWQHGKDALSAIRRKVFIDEQHVPEQLEWDEDDDSATHFLARIGNRNVACARLTADGKIGRMAVLEQYRNQGIGQRLLQQVIAHARDEAYPTLYMHAQASATGFYEKAGFTVSGEPFMEAGIPHREMCLQLSD